MSNDLTRRTFLKSASAGAAASLTLTAASYARIVGANDRINLAQVGCGGRGFGAHMAGIHKHDKAENAQYIAVSDPWSVPRDRAAAAIKEWYGLDARKCVSYREILEMKDVDAVLFASPDHQHTTHLEAAAKAKKDVYIEKPIAMDFKALKRAVDAINESGVVCQVGTQLRSMPSFTGCRELYKTGILGKVGRIEQCRNSARPYWYNYIKREIQEKDVDWKEFLGDRKKRPFDAVQYSSWYGYRDFTDGPVTNLGCHFLDLVHYITGASYPVSCVCHGGTFTWIDEHKFDCPDHVEATWIYPEGFMVHYSTNFGNGSGLSFKIYGDQGVMDMTKWHIPTLSADGGSKGKGTIRGITEIKHVERPDHFQDFLMCIRSRQTPNASIEAGYQHALAGIMAVRAFDSGRRQLYNHKKREISEG